MGEGSPLMNSALNNESSPVERNLQFLAFVPSSNLTRFNHQQSTYRDIFVHPAIMLAVQYVNSRGGVCLGDEVYPLRVNVSVDYVESGVSCVPASQLMCMHVYHIIMVNSKSIS